MPHNNCRRQLQLCPTLESPPSARKLVEIVFLIVDVRCSFSHCNGSNQLRATNTKTNRNSPLRSCSSATETATATTTSSMTSEIIAIADVGLWIRCYGATVGDATAVDGDIDDVKGWLDCFLFALFNEMLMIFKLNLRLRSL